MPDSRLNIYELYLWKWKLYILMIVTYKINCNYFTHTQRTFHSKLHTHTPFIPYIHYNGNAAELAWIDIISLERDWDWDCVCHQQHQQQWKWMCKINNKNYYFKCHSRCFTLETLLFQVFLHHPANKHDNESREVFIPIQIWSDSYQARKWPT